MEPLWGIDLGGTKIEGVILEDRDHPRVLKRVRIATEAALGYEHIVNRITQIIEVMTTETGLKPSTLGIGTPGTLDPILQQLKNANTTALNGRNLQRDLEAILRFPVKIANDANCFAVAETMMGCVVEEVPKARVVFGVIMGTGVGAGIVVDGKPLSGRQGIAGEWGHNFLHESGGDCYCGQVGCVERIISGPALERYYASLAGHLRPLPAIVARYQEGKDAMAIQTIDRLIHYFGKAMGPIINILDPDAIVLGGGLGNIDLLYTKGVAEVQKYVFNHRLDTVFLKPKLGDSAGVFGAALL